MDDNIQLSELQRDAITEFLNIGMGRAAGSLSEMANEEVKLSVPSLELLSRQKIVRCLNSQLQQSIVAVKQHFSGSFWGEALLLFPQEKSLELVQILVKNEVPQEMLTELEEDALTEVGNIILNACLSSLADILGTDLANDLPIFKTGTVMEIFDINVANKDEQVMFLRIHFALQTKNIVGYVAFILELPSLEQFKAKVNNYLEGIGN